MAAPDWLTLSALLTAVAQYKWEYRSKPMRKTRVAPE